MSVPTYDSGRSFDMTTLTANYQDVGAVLAGPAFGFIMYNTSDVDVQMSFDDGTNDGPIIPAGGVMSSSVIGSNPKGIGRKVLKEGTQIQVKWIDGVAGASGKIIINIER